MDNKRKGFLSRGSNKPINEPIVAENTPEVTIKKVKIQSLIDSHLYYTGRESGELYEWSKSGAIVEVDECDVPELLKRRLGAKTCCGGGTNLIFQLAD